MKSVITTHILDTHKGRPAANVEVSLYQWQQDGWQHMASAQTDDDGRITDWLGDRQREQGLYRLTFATAEYFSHQGVISLYPQVDIHFQIENADEHYHIPLLLSANGYSTYRGS
ncbi:5-hydroxyisourate hydrolase [Bacterioplanes sanyensis]|jgi:5-hydroxyisourate hydrolase|uniref:hydroxyisourate hydrolase n=1 Tax=Bacterioplanes sanyensis TaxID=1249553 RepID=UPI00167C1310|nr:hydroxyisourate hydrolase [Bacterioplanes sanyensis]GGY36920.1 5-hydroxyisourate hydrolase [Bacterioplanes sanyensis]